MHLIPTKIHSVGSATMPRRVAVDPRFGARLRELRRQRQLSLRELAERAHQGTSYIGELETGQKQPTVDVAANLDRALAANGKLARNPRHIDTTTIDSLHAILAHQRRLEDSIGSAPLVSPVRTQVAMLEHLVEEAPDNDRRRTLLDTAAQWAQFAAWLTTTTGNHVEGRDRYLRTMEWATEAGNPHMAATALSMREHLKRLRLGPSRWVVAVRSGGAAG